MKKLFLLLLTFVGFSLLSFTQDSKAEFKFGFETYDFGKIPQGVPVTVEYSFTNVGDQPLVITGASATCGCTKPSYPDQPILKNQQGNISVTYDAKKIGIFNKTVTLMSNSTKPTMFLYLKGEVVAN